MNGKIAKICFIILFIFSFAVPSPAKYSGGTGEPNDPYLIATPEDLNSIGLDANDWDKHFKMIADIDLSAYTGTSFNIIGTDLFNSFTGVFDGNGHTINNFLWESEISSRAIGLFGYVRENATITDLRVENADVNAPNCNRVSALVGEMKSSTTIINCSSSGKVVGDFYVGGIAGDLFGQVIRCYSSCTVSGGGAGVITGHVDGNLIDSFATGVVSGTEQAGGLAGRNNGNMTNCYSFGVVNSMGSLSGGLVGINWGTISNSYSQADVQGTDDVGGLAGKNQLQGIIENCFSNGTVNGTTRVGGLVGFYDSGTISNCYSSGGVSGDDDVGGLVGHDDTGSYISCFWDIDINPDVNGIGNTTDPNVIGKSTIEMRTKSTFADAGWDMVNIWDIGENQTYPFLRTHLPGDINKDDQTDFLDLAILAQHWLIEQKF